MLSCLHFGVGKSKKLKKTLEGNTRRCLVTGHYSGDVPLLRFVVGPNQQLCFDIDQKLPGRGLWVQADAKVLTQAFAKGSFSRAAKQKVLNDYVDLEKVEYALRERVVSLLALGRRAGSSIGGIDKVLKKILAYRQELDKKKIYQQQDMQTSELQDEKSEWLALIFCAQDCGNDNLSKIMHQTKSYSGFIHVERTLLGHEIGQAFGRSSLSFCTVAPGKLSLKLYAHLKLLKAVHL